MAVVAVPQASGNVAAQPRTPRAASERAYLREALPPIYRDRRSDEPVALLERWVLGLEEVLDPIVLQLDNLAAHLDPVVTERDWIDTLTTWLGMRVDRELPLDVRRARVCHAMDLNRTRGTLKGLQLALDVTFPGAGIRATDTATTTIGDKPFGSGPAPTPRLEITLPTALDEEQLRVLDRLIGDQLPAHLPQTTVEFVPPRGPQQRSGLPPPADRP